MSRLHRSFGFLLKALLGLVAAGLLALGTCALLPRSTSALPGSDSIAEIRRVSLGGFEQTLLVRGHRRHAPILLYVHGGPGSTQLPAAPRYSTQLEKHFVVVHWDQRGAGASCSGVDWKTVTLEQIVRDTIELSEKLGKGRKIVIIGHSWGRNASNGASRLCYTIDCTSTSFQPCLLCRFPPSFSRAGRTTTQPGHSWKSTRENSEHRVWKWSGSQKEGTSSSSKRPTNFRRA